MAAVYAEEVKTASSHTGSLSSPPPNPPRLYFFIQLLHDWSWDVSHSSTILLLTKQGFRKWGLEKALERSQRQGLPKERLLYSLLDTHMKVISLIHTNVAMCAWSKILYWDIKDDLSPVLPDHHSNAY